MATTGRIVYHGDDETIKKERREFSLTDEIMELINNGGGGGAISGVKVNGTIVNPDQAGYVGLTIPGVINSLASNSTSDALSAKQGKVLYEYIQALQHVGHFLALWNTATGLPMTNPETSPYTYNTGDYYVVSNVAGEGGTNYKPNGSSYTINVASTTVESGEVQVNDLYFYDGYERRLLDNSGGGGSIAVDSSLSATSTNPVQNAVITNRLNQIALDANTKTFFLADGNDLTTAQAAYDWIVQGKMALVTFNGETYIYKTTASNEATFEDVGGYTTIDNNGTTGVYLKTLELSLNGTTVEQISLSTKSQSNIIPSYLATDKNYSTAYTPQYDGSPATKKYVDDKFAAVPVYTAGSNIDITSNQISTIRNGYVYVTCTDGASVKNKTGTSAEGNYTPAEGDLVMIHFTQGCSVGGPDISIDGGTAIPFYIGVESANAGNMYFGSVNVSKMFIYTNGRLVGDAVKDNNTTYAAGTGLALSNGMFSVDTTTIATQSDINVKAFFLEDDEDTTTAAEILQRYFEGLSEEEQRYPIIFTGGKTYLMSAGQGFRGTTTMTLRFVNIEPERNVIGYSTTELSQDTIEISGTIDTETFAVSNVAIGTGTNILGDFLEAKSGGTYITPRTPTYDGDPTTKKYVDDKVSGAISSGTTAPSSPVEGQLWYDTTNDALKVYDGTAWVAVGGGGGGVNITNVTVATAYGTAAKVGTTTAGNYTPTAGDFIMVNFVNGCSVASPTLNIDNSGAKNIRTGNANATTSTLALGSTSNSNIKMLMYYDGTYYRTWSTSNNTYSGMSASTATTGTSTSSSLISASVLKQAITAHAITLDPDSPLDVTTIWAGTETQYNALSSKGATTAYLCVEE